jgi:hypothetical protein
MIPARSFLAVYWVILVSSTCSIASSWVLMLQNTKTIGCLSRPSSTIFQSTTLDEVTDITKNIAFVKAVAASGLHGTEVPVVLKAIHEAFSYYNSMEDEDILGNVNIDFQYDTSNMPVFQESGAGIVGATGRVLLLETNDLDETMMELIQYVVAQKMDQLLYNEEERILTQPILISIHPGMTNDDDSPKETKLKQRLPEIIQEQVAMYEMATPLPVSNDNAIIMEESLIPTIQVELDGAYVADECSQEQVWDTSSVLVFDDLVSEDLRKRLLNVILGRTSDNIKNDWDDITNGPNPERWVRGGLIDIPEKEEEEESLVYSTSWGLSDEGIEEICFQHHDAIEEFEMILSQLFPQFLVTRLPEAVFGATVSPLNANAPTVNDRFDYHIDGDPNLTPPSPWTDVYGRYPNRIRGKPRFMSCILYLNDEWEEEWGAPTRFLDLPTDSSGYEVIPKPGRCVLMDQDCSHTVVAPNASAGNRPRYSLVWKLILHPRVALQDMTNLAGERRQWPEPILFGSANRTE